MLLSLEFLLRNSRIGDDKRIAISKDESAKILDAPIICRSLRAALSGRSTNSSAVLIVASCDPLRWSRGFLLDGIGLHAANSGARNK